MRYLFIYEPVSNVDRIVAIFRRYSTVTMSITLHICMGYDLSFSHSYR
jgi:hypothetical protein